MRAVARNRRVPVAGALALLASVLATSTATATAATGTAAPAFPARANSSDLRVPDIAWAPCGARHARYQCATVTVPLDYDQPSGATTELALARWPAKASAGRIGTVFVNPGGPGGSGVGFLLSGFGEALGANLRGRFDVVGFDPRGVGASDPLRCFDSRGDLFRFFRSVPVFPYREGQYRPYFEHYRSLAARCLDDRDDRRIAQHMSTGDVARDLDLLRRAVGDPGLTYLGFSYGSYLGNTYANLFPRKIRALAIDGVLHPRLWESGSHIQLDRTSTGTIFREFLRLCDAARTHCPFWEPGGATARWQALATALHRKPVVLPDAGGLTYTYDLLIADSNSAMYAPEVWDGEGGFAAFLDLLADLVLADRATARLAATRSAVLNRLAPTRPEAQYNNGFDAYYGNLCADTQYPRSFAAYRAIGAYAAAGSRWGPYWWWGNAGCAAWPAAADRYAGPWTADTSAPVLAVGNYYDPATDYAGAVATSQLLPNSRLLTYAGWGHTAYGRSACVTGHVDAYLLTGALPPRRTVCPANPNPFRESAARRMTPAEPLAGLPPAAGVGRSEGGAVTR